MKIKKILKLLSITMSLFLMLGVITYGGKFVDSENAENTQNVNKEANLQKEKDKTNLQAEEKSETVYVILESDGKVVDERVVNRLWSKDIGNYASSNISDFGIYDSLKNMEFDVKPIINSDEIIWPGELLNKGSIYYEGVTNKELPIDIAIEYYLDGVKTKAEDLAGKDGRVKISIKLTNKMKVSENINYEDFHNEAISKLDELYIPMLVQVSYAADLSKFNNIKAEDAFKVIVGKSMNINYAVLPFPEEKIEFEMDGKNIELNSILFTMFPQMPSMQEFDVEEQITEMYNGVVKIGDGIAELKDGSDEIADGLKKVRKGGNDFIGGINTLSEGSNQLNQNGQKLLEGFDANIAGISNIKAGAGELSLGLETLNQNGNEIVKAAQEVSSSLAAINQGTEGLLGATSAITGGIGQLKEMNSQLAQAANMLVQMNKEGTDLHNLGLAILAEKEALEKLEQGSTQLEQGIKDLASGTKQLNVGIDQQFIPGLQQYNDGIGQLHLGSKNLYNGISEFKNGQENLKLGIFEYTSGVGQVNSGIIEIKDNVGKLFGGLDEIIKGQNELSNGLVKVKGEGVNKLAEGVIEGVNELKFGQAKKEKLEFLAKNYKSFISPEKNKNSSVQFIMQTREIKIETKN